MNPSSLRRAVLTFSLLMVCVVALACQTPNRGTSEITSPEETKEPEETAPVPGDPAPKTEAVATSTLEHDVDRPGSTYRDIAMETADPAACKRICDDQMRCMAFTYVHPTDKDGAHCLLKHSIPDKVEGKPCCISGVNPRAERRLEKLAARGFELNTDRPGGDFRSFEMDRPEPALCKEACENLRACKAYTYVRPGHKGDSAVCRLKDKVTDKVADQDCCISGVK